MKFAMAVLVYLTAGVLMGWGILEAVHGSFWLLIVSVFSYAALLARFGCLPAKVRSH